VQVGVRGDEVVALAILCVAELEVPAPIGEFAPRAGFATGRGAVRIGQVVVEALAVLGVPSALEVTAFRWC